ncbi:MAG: hypothetical protein MZW92_15940 [Comamonadaceae bacterium]|nr:hypothetical protein [Comamonadaceae bacterium]
MHWDNPLYRGHRAPGRGIRARPRGQGHALPHRAAPHAVHQHRLEPDPDAARRRCCSRRPATGRTRRASSRRSIPGTSATSRRPSTTTSSSGRELLAGAHGRRAARGARVLPGGAARGDDHAWPACRCVSGMTAAEIVETERQRIAGVLRGDRRPRTPVDPARVHLEQGAGVRSAAARRGEPGARRCW